MNLNSIRELIDEKRIHEALKKVDEALSACADNPSLWVMRGDLLQLVDVKPIPSLGEVERSYLKAMELDSENLEAIGALAHFYDAVLPDEARATEFAKKYVSLSEEKCAEMNTIISGTSWMSHAPHHR